MRSEGVFFLWADRWFATWERYPARWCGANSMHLTPVVNSGHMLRTLLELRLNILSEGLSHSRNCRKRSSSLKIISGVAFLVQI